MRTPYIFLLICAFAMFLSSIVSADWHYDFNDPNWTPPDSFRVLNNVRPNTPPPSDTFEIRYENGYARLWDTRGWGNQGAEIARMGDTEVFSDVRVSATFNPSRDSNKRTAAVTARDGEQGRYSAWLWQYEDRNEGVLGLTKTLADGTEAWEDVNLEAVDPSRSWILSLEAVNRTDDRNRTYVDLTAMLIDPETEEIHRTYARRDYDRLFLESGTSWVAVGPALPHGARYPMNTTFDDISSVTIPEPSSAAMIVTSVLGLLVLRKRR